MNQLEESLTLVAAIQMDTKPSILPPQPPYISRLINAPYLFDTIIRLVLFVDKPLIQYTIYYSDHRTEDIKYTYVDIMESEITERKKMMGNSRRTSSIHCPDI